MRMATVLLSAIVLVAAPAQAGILPGINLHTSTIPFSCGGISSGTTCNDINPNAPGGSATVLILLTGIPGMGATGAQFGIDYASTGFTTGVFVTNNTCSGSYLTIAIAGPNGTWPNSGAGIAVTFGSCVSPLGEDGIIPVMYLYTAVPPMTGTMAIVGDPVADDMIYTDCGQVTQNVSKTGEWDFAGTDGFADCFPAPATVEATWGQIKSEFQ